MDESEKKSLIAIATRLVQESGSDGQDEAESKRKLYNIALAVLNAQPVAALESVDDIKKLSDGACVTAWSIKDYEEGNILLLRQDELLP